MFINKERMRNNILKIHVFLFLVVFITGCASFENVRYQDVFQNYKNVESNNGISTDEAITIAQYYLIKKGLDDRVYTLKPIGIEKWIQWEKDGAYIRLMDPPSPTFEHPLIYSWIVLFRDTKGSQFWGHYPVIPLYVEVDMRTGEVRSWGEYNDKKK